MKKLLIEGLSSDELLGQLREIVKELIPAQKPCNQTNELWTRDETAEFFQVSYQTLHNWKKHKILNPIRVGTRVYYKKADVDALLNKEGGSHAN